MLQGPGSVNRTVYWHAHMFIGSDLIIFYTIITVLNNLKFRFRKFKKKNRFRFRKLNIIVVNTIKYYSS